MTELFAVAPSPQHIPTAARMRLRRDTPLAHIEARHRQAEAAAKEEVRRALLKRGLAVYNYVEGGDS